MTSALKNLFEFMALMGKLKQTRRTGWVQRGVQGPESIADHMYRMAALSFLVDPQSGLDRDRCIKLSIVHDMAECIVGDLTPSDGVSKEDKHAQEKAAMEHIRNLVGEDAGAEMFSLWEDYENQSSAEARFVKDLDKFDMILQAHEYEKQENRPRDLQDFFNSTAGKFKNPQVIAWVQELHYQRDNSSKEITHTKEKRQQSKEESDIPSECGS